MAQCVDPRCSRPSGLESWCPDPSAECSPAQPAPVTFVLACGNRNGGQRGQGDRALHPRYISRQRLSVLIRRPGARLPVRKESEANRHPHEHGK